MDKDALTMQAINELLKEMKEGECETIDAFEKKFVIACIHYNGGITKCRVRAHNMKEEQT